MIRYHTTYSWDFLGIESIPQYKQLPMDSKSDVIIGVIDSGNYHPYIIWARKIKKKMEKQKKSANLHPHPHHIIQVFSFIFILQEFGLSQRASMMKDLALCRRNSKENAQLVKILHLPIATGIELS